MEYMMHSSGSSEPPGGDLLRLQVAEYEALMSRGNYFMTFYVGVGGVFVSLATFVVDEWVTTKDPTLLWIAGAIFQIALHAWGKFIEEDYLLVSYLETVYMR